MWRTALKSFKAILIGVSLLLLSLAGSAQAENLKIGVVSIAKLVSEAPQAKSVEKSMRQRFADREAKLATEQQAIGKLKEELERDGPTMTASQSAKKEKEFRDRSRELKRSVDDFNEDFNIAMNEERGKLLREITKAIEVYAEQEKYDLVLSKEGIYASARVDITEKVLERLKKQFKPAGPGAN